MRMLIAVLLLILTSTAGAQLDVLAKTTPAQRADAQTAYLTTMLSLTPEQHDKVAALNLSYAQKAQPILTGSAWAVTKAQGLRALQDAKETDLQPILTPAQVATYQSGKDAMKTAVEATLAKEVGAH
ncbi:MAG TPA: hypothetical protein VGR62_16385 [Candidatus Binatia bacterium]|jgi:hypothetical protein|nr:hypothetical protein [Candidatus Binatia bacterium]